LIIVQVPNSDMQFDANLIQL